MQGDVQQFASAPQAVGNRKKYRDDKNIMHDSRVMRGNTYSTLLQPQQDMQEVQKQREAQRRRLMRANQTIKKPARTPDPPLGSKHNDMQTDSYLEELTERTVEFEAEAQSEYLLDRPPSPLFMPAKIGVDMDTQVEAGELFNFDMEVEPLLEVIVGKTLELSMIEMLEEVELESIRSHQKEFEQTRSTELQEVQRMERADKRRQDEMERRQTQQAAQREIDLSMMRKVVSRSLANAHLSSLKSRAMQHLLDAGVFADTMDNAVESCFMPEMLKMVARHVEKSVQDRKLFGSVMQSTLATRVETHSKHLENERRRYEAIDEAERQVRLQRAIEEAKRKAESDRIAFEQRVMIEWEQYRPPAPEPLPEIQVTDFNEETLAATLADGTVGKVEAEAAAELTAMFSALGDGQGIMGKILSRGGNEDSTPMLGDFRTADGFAIKEPSAQNAEGDGEGVGEGPPAEPAEAAEPSPAEDGVGGA